MSLLQKALDRGSFAVTAEMAPPKGYDFSEALETAALLKGKVHGVNVTDMQSACLKASSLGLCIHLKQVGIEPILQMTGRDRSRMALMADILSPHPSASIPCWLSPAITLWWAIAKRASRYMIWTL